MSQADTVPGLVQIGETLRAAREGRGVTLEQVAAQLRCDLRVIEALEGGRFDDVGPPVFARGHLLRYAALLGEPGEAMVEEWSQLAAAGTSAELMSGLHGPRGRDLRQVRRRLVTAAALLCAAAIGVWAVQNLPGRLRVAATPPAVTAPAASASAPAKPGVVASVAAAPILARSGAPAATAPSGMTAPAAVEAPVRAPPATAPRGLVQLRVAFSSESWLEIYDVRNRRLFFGLATPGAPVDVQGRAPLRVIVGNAPAATVELNGRRVDVPPDAMRGRRAAALRVNADGRLLALPRA